MMDFPNGHVPFDIVDELYGEHAHHAPLVGYGDDPNEHIEIVEAENHEVTYELHESEGTVYRFINLL